MRDGQGRVAGGLATTSPDDDQFLVLAPHATRMLLQRGVDAVEEFLLGGCPPATVTDRLGPQVNHSLLEELRATTARLVDLDRRVGAPRVLRDAERHARTLAALLASTPEHSRLRPQLLLATSEAALLNAALACDQNEPVAGGRWARLATALAHLAGVPDLAAAAVTLQAKLLLTQDDHSTALKVLRQLDVARPSARGQAYALGWEAVAHAAAGRSYETMAALDRAEAALDRSAGQPPTWWHPITPAAGPVCAQSLSFLRLGRPALAHEVLDRARGSWPTNLHRGSGELLAELARASLEIGDAELACEHATAALEVARATGSLRQLGKLAGLARRMESVTAVPAAPEFRAQLGAVMPT